MEQRGDRSTQCAASWSVIGIGGQPWWEARSSGWVVRGRSGRQVAAALATITALADDPQLIQALCSTP